MGNITLFSVRLLELVKVKNKIEKTNKINNIPLIKSRGTLLPNIDSSSSLSHANTNKNRRNIQEHIIDSASTLSFLPLYLFL